MIIYKGRQRKKILDELLVTMRERPKTTAGFPFLFSSGKTAGYCLAFTLFRKITKQSTVYSVKTNN